MKLIASADRNWAIGKDNSLLVRIPADMKRFREMTMGKVVVVGRKTLSTFPNGLPLNNRTNIILTTNRSFQVKGAVVVHSEAELKEELGRYDSDDIYVIGGESVYRMLLDACDTAYITKIDYTYEADAYLPNFDEDPSWELVQDSEEQTYFDLEFYYRTYRRKKRHE